MGRHSTGGSHRASKGESTFSYIDVDAKTGEPIVKAPPTPAPAGGAAETPESPAKAKTERRQRSGVRRLGRLAFGLTMAGAVGTGLVAVGNGIWGGGDAKPRVETGPALLETGKPTPPKGADLLAQVQADVQRNVNNGENGNKVHIAPGILTIKAPDGQRVSYADPIVEWANLPTEAAQQVEAGKFDPSLLDGRVFALNPGHETGPNNFDHGVVPIDVTDTEATFTPAPNFHIVDAAVNWESEANVAVDQAGAPLEINSKSGQVMQHTVNGDWHTFTVGQQVPTPPPHA